MPTLKALTVSPWWTASSSITASAATRATAADAMGNNHRAGLRYVIRRMRTTTSTVP